MAEIVFHSRLIDDRFAFKLRAVSIDGQRHYRVNDGHLTFSSEFSQIRATFLLGGPPKLVALVDGLEVGELPVPPQWHCGRVFDCNTVLFENDGEDRCCENWYGRPDGDFVIAMNQATLDDGSRVFQRVPWIEIDGQRLADIVSLVFHRITDTLVVKNGFGDICFTSEEEVWEVEVEFCGFARIEYE